MSEPAPLPLVMVVDDFADNRELVCELLTHEGLRVIEARSGLEAIDQARASRPDVVLMDLALPGIDGWEATRRLLADPMTARVRVIAVTAHAQVESIARARAAGCVATVIKPFDPEELLRQVRRALVDRALPVLVPPAAPRARGGQPGSGRLTRPRMGYTAGEAPPPRRDMHPSDPSGDDRPRRRA